MKNTLFKCSMLLLSFLMLGATVLPSTIVLANEIEIVNSETEPSKYEVSKSEIGTVYVQENPKEIQETPKARIQVDHSSAWRWKEISRRNSSSAQDDKFKANLANFIFNIAFTYFGGKVIKGAIKVSEFSGAVATGFLASVKKGVQPGKTVYYTITTYEDSDSKNYYVKKNTQAYSDSARKKLIGSYDTIHKFTKN